MLRAKAKATILNLGAGNRIMTDAVNHDRVKHRPEIDVAHDLNELPWPWPDNRFDLIVARAVIEHLKPDLIEITNECWRILRPEGVLYLKLPYWASERSYDDPTHRWRYTLATCNVLDPDTIQGKQYAFYTERKWRIIKPARLNRARTSLFVSLQVRK